MQQFGKLVMSAAVVILVVATFSSPAYAAYNCKGDKQVDVPIQFVVAKQGAARVRLSAYGGSDKSGYVVPSVWRLYSGGRQVDYFPKTNLVFVSKNMLKEANLDGLAPGNYEIELTSLDWCNNARAVRQPLTIAVPSGDAVLPNLSTPTTVLVGLQSGQFSQIQFELTDDSGIQRVTVSINGTIIKDYQYANGVAFRWWFELYPSDNTLSVLEGPYYYVNYADSYKGTYSYVEVVAVDVNGNESRQSAMLVL